MIEVDLEILLHMAQLIEGHISEIGFFRPTRVVNEFARIFERRLILKRKLHIWERFARQFMGNPDIYVPKIYRNLSSGRVLTMEYVEGIKVTELEKLEKAGLDRKIIAAKRGRPMLEQVFRYGFFHGDPHPGNIFILPGNIICYFDFGMMGSVDHEAREHFADIVYGYVLRDAAKTTAALLKVVEWEEEPDRRNLERDISDFMEAYLYRPLKEVHLNALLQKLINVLSRHKLRFPPDIFLMIKAVSEVEGVGLMLDPDFDITERAAPFIRRIKAERYQPSRIMASMVESGGELLQTVSVLPAELLDVLKQVRQGRAKIGFEHRGLEHLVFELDRSSNRVAFALIISSLIIDRPSSLQPISDLICSVYRCLDSLVSALPGSLEFGSSFPYFVQAGYSAAENAENCLPGRHEQQFTIMVVLITLQDGSESEPQSG